MTMRQAGKLLRDQEAERQRVHDAAVVLGRKGGQAGKGSPKKLRAARKAAKTRWARARTQKLPF